MVFIGVIPPVGCTSGFRVEYVFLGQVSVFSVGVGSGVFLVSNICGASVYESCCSVASVGGDQSVESVIGILVLFIGGAVAPLGHTRLWPTPHVL